ncbi:MAG: T9SS type A sorting domain-containing protein [Flavobacteriales bacterium]|nr:T9SS type A sorting domain-containing protein [Flavobacteriales bacterium]
MLNELLLSLTKRAARAIPLAMAAALAGTATAQNLVPNPSFEDTALCNTYDPVRLQAARWFNVNWATPDVYECDLVRRCGVVWDPADSDVQASGYQYARSGTRFAGAYHWYGVNSSDTKEYLTVRLDQDLIHGTNYSVSLYYSRADGYKLATDRISAYFGPDSFFVQDYRTLPLQPQVDLMDPEHEYLTDEVNWTYLADSFVATGNERYMTIGSFLDSSQVNGIMAPTGSFNYCYYYYDDVSVVAIKPSGIGEVQFGIVQLADGSFRLNKLPYGPITVRVLDVCGKLIREVLASSSNGIIDLDFGGLDMANGLYVVNVLSKEGRGVARFVWSGG